MKSRPPQKFYFDLGGNNGDSIRSFLGYAKADGYGNMDPFGKDGDFHVIIVEANHVHVPSLITMVDEMEAKNAALSFTLFAPVAVDVKTGKTTFFHDKILELEAAATTVENSASAYNTNSETVPTIDIVELFEEIGITAEDYVLVKLDIEGAEYKVLRHWLRRGLMNFIDDFHIEWHSTNIFVLAGNAEAAANDQCLHWMLEDFSGLNMVYHG
jgi:FkbM family methyltransferase